MQKVWMKILLNKKIFKLWHFIEKAFGKNILKFHPYRHFIELNFAPKIALLILLIHLKDLQGKFSPHGVNFLKIVRFGCDTLSKKIKVWTKLDSFLLNKFSSEFWYFFCTTPYFDLIKENWNFLTYAKMNFKTFSINYKIFLWNIPPID